MTRILRAELLKVTRRTMVLAVLAVLLVATISITAIVFTGADPATGPGQPRLPTVEDLSAAGGGTEAFSLGVSFMGLFVFVLFIANWSGEFSQATFRTLLLKEPRRLAVLGGKLAGLLVYLAGVLAVAAVLTWTLSLALAPATDIPTGEWFTLRGIEENARDYLNAFIGLGTWACYGMLLGVLIRSTPIALAAGIVWAGPVEHIVQNNWAGVVGWFPGLLLESLAVGGTPDASYERVLVLTAGYVAVALMAVGLTFSRRDVVN